MKKICLQKILLQQTAFFVRDSFGTEFREFVSIFVSRTGIPSRFLFRGMVWNRIPSVCFYFCSTERNSELFSLPRNGSEFSVPRNSRNSTGTNQCSVFRRIIFGRKLPTLVQRPLMAELVNP